MERDLIAETLSKHIIDFKNVMSIVWTIDDVKGVSPHLNDEQAIAVLQAVGHEYNANIGVTYKTIVSMSERLFPLSNALAEIFKEVKDKELSVEEFKADIKEAVEKYGNDRVDIRLGNNGMFYGVLLTSSQITGLLNCDKTDTFAILDFCDELEIHYGED